MDENIYLMRNTYPEQFKTVCMSHLYKHLVTATTLLWVSAAVYVYCPIEVYL
jgi:hypothetical protein